MPEVVQAKCPGCKKVLRIPADWLNQPVKCKHCGMVLQAKPRSGSEEAKEEVPAKKAPHPPAPSAVPAQASAGPSLSLGDAPIIRVPSYGHRSKRATWIMAGVAILAL